MTRGQLQLIEPCVECNGPASDFYIGVRSDGTTRNRWICPACDLEPRSYSEGIVIARLMHQGVSYSEAKAQTRQEKP